MIFGKKYNVHFDFYSGIIVMIALEKNVTNPQVNNWGGRGGVWGGKTYSWICMGFEVPLT